MRYCRQHVGPARDRGWKVSGYLVRQCGDDRSTDDSKPSSVVWFPGCQNSQRRDFESLSDAMNPVIIFNYGYNCESSPSGCGLWLVSETLF